MGNLTIKQQIDSLKIALETVKTVKSVFVCVEVKEGVYDITDKYFRIQDITQYVPLLTFENAQMVCRKYKLKMPKIGNESGGWWDDGLKKPRLAFVNWMIRELEKQSKEIEDQIDTLETIKGRIIDRSESFICNAIQDVLVDKKIIYKANYSGYDASTYISICTRENAKHACIEEGVEIPGKLEEEVGGGLIISSHEWCLLIG